MGAAAFFKLNNSNKKREDLAFQNTALFMLLSVKTADFTNCGFLTCKDTLIKKIGVENKM
jgi:hypothetical protein